MSKVAVGDRVRITIDGKSEVGDVIEVREDSRVLIAPTHRGGIRSPSTAYIVRNNDIDFTLNTKVGKAMKKYYINSGYYKQFAIAMIMSGYCVQVLHDYGDKVEIIVLEGSIEDKLKGIHNEIGTPDTE